MDDSHENMLLIVDDEEINRAILANLFGGTYQILEAEDGLAGLACIEAHADSLSAVLLDVVMPRLGGIELLRRLADRGLPDRVPVFLITSDTTISTMREAYELGVMDVIL